LQVLQQNGFKRAYKKLHAPQKQAVNDAVVAICENPNLGEQKKGDLAGIFVYKFTCNTQLYLLAYAFDPATLTLVLLGTHENFYRELKR
jgi:mRNA-degrading endonuclease YafQ of YafQ-DinJ toxin-antitoxin module